MYNYAFQLLVQNQNIASENLSTYLHVLVLASPI